MTLQDVIDDIHALYEDLKVYERKYGILSETFYELYMDGHEPENDDWVLDWSDWAGAYQILLRRREQYRQTVSSINPHDRGWPAVTSGAGARLKGPKGLKGHRGRIEPSGEAALG